MIYEIPLNEGLNTQPDPEDIGLGGCTVINNVELDKEGRIYKRPGRSIRLYIDDSDLANLIRWVPSDTEPQWIGYDANSKQIIKIKL